MKSVIAALAVLATVASAQQTIVPLETPISLDAQITHLSYDRGEHDPATDTWRVEVTPHITTRQIAGMDIMIHARMTVYVKGSDVESALARVEIAGVETASYAAEAIRKVQALTAVEKPR